MKQEITYEDYNKVEIKIGTVLKVSKNEKARKPSLAVSYTHLTMPTKRIV